MKQLLNTICETQGKLALISSAMDTELDNGGISFEIGQASFNEIQNVYAMLDVVSTRMAAMVTA